MGGGGGGQTGGARGEDKNRLTFSVAFLTSSNCDVRVVCFGLPGRCKSVASVGASLRPSLDGGDQLRGEERGRRGFPCHR